MVTIVDLAKRHGITHVQHLARTARNTEPDGVAYVYRPVQEPSGLDWQIGIAVRVLLDWELASGWSPSFAPAYSDVVL